MLYAQETYPCAELHLFVRMHAGGSQLLRLLQHAL